MTESPKNLAKKCIQYECKSCQFITANKSNYDTHCLTAKHIKGLKRTKKDQKNAKYSCETCEYNTDHKTKYERHLLTAKHLKNTIPLQQQEEEEEEQDDDDEDEMKDMFMNMFEKMIMEQNQFIHEKFQELAYKQEELAEKQEGTNEKIQEFVENTHEKLLDIAEKQENTHEKLIDIANHPTTTTINNNNNHNHFNLTFFLNETCKDAIVIDDFFDSLEITDDQFYRFGEIGFKRALAELLATNIKQLSYIERPIHCSDAKRKTHHVKTEHGWTNDKEKYKFPITKGFKDFQWRELSKIQKHNPTYDDSDSICIKKQTALSEWWSGGSEDILFVDKIFNAFEKMANEMVITKKYIH
jgi:hypothetical protein